MSAAAETIECATIASEGWTVAVAPRRGAVLSCDYRGGEILRRTAAQGGADPFGVGHFPLAPYSNRIADGSFVFEGERYVIKPNVRGHPHPLHGTAWLGGWSLVARARDSLSLAFEHAAGAGWPWPFSLRQTIGVDGPALTIGLTLKNMADRAAPAGMGFHPYFSDPHAARLSFEAAGLWEADESALPVAWKPLSPSSDFSRGRPLAGASIDNCFTGWKGPARILWRDRPFGVEISASPDLAFAVLYVSQAQGCFCFEPVSHMNDALNWAARRNDTGLRVLQPGESWTVSMTLRAFDAGNAAA
ncbi:aldose 1-epimerase [Amphiplicatus metriothermophilus]|uniref:Aldose 1-epimerase n=1 Tax=Amphiplicatus metriothermophilus TaxID=1519374 RepID=A0A239PWI7_9PROT|nr:aldose 1-epimerase [Amphiplicatus metriothermophilus]MBB5518995.1 aldose 1-epimerase [Amphiplicatus metriothermophilus]SNT74615.1 aldose 1-epimerase [Amphiplicatus metriothermophilus]